MIKTTFALFALFAVGAAVWLNNGPAHPDALHTIVLAVKQPHNAAATCASMLMDISDPESPNYGKQKTLAQVNRVMLDMPRVRRVERWLSANKYEFRTVGDYIKVTAEVSKLEKLLEARFHRFSHEEFSGRHFYVSDDYSVPSEIRKDIDFVLNTQLPSIRPKITSFQRSSSIGKRQDGQTTPALILQTYGIDNTSVSIASQALFEALGQNFSPDDLAQFEENFNLPSVAISKITGDNNGGECSDDPNVCGEANLDVQYMIAVAQSPVTSYWVIDQSAQDPFYDWIIALSQTAKPAQVHSVSYGSLAPEDPEQDKQRFNTEACKLGLRGVTIVVASGDDGVANFPARQDPSKCGFTPSFPATSPYVLSVGATMGPEEGSTEIACTSDAGGLITTGGGFSTYFSRPSYQDKAVKQYLQNAPNLPSTSDFAAEGRAYPDVAALGHNYVIQDGGQSLTVSGTSASAPVFAAMLTLINEARLQAGKNTLGFVNPAVYKAPSPVWNDITQGRNNCAAGQQGQQVCCDEGFTATTGWDPLTGFGSPNFRLLRKYLKAL